MKKLNVHWSLRFRVLVMTLLSVLLFCVSDVYASGSAYTRADRKSVV